MSLFHIFKFTAVLSPYVLTLQGTEPRRQMRHRLEDIAGDTAGGTTREQRTTQVKKRSQSSAARYCQV
ncbi:unnamed protein product [Staurois parvus]|uniref:Secreted protein n=1 Tax=Staurois parvus TaxID=386267 RepID=A0ABN9ECJ2_9NEOB|nr:unnamed protein product [Staurois parvus]